MTTIKKSTSKLNFISPFLVPTPQPIPNSEKFFCVRNFHELKRCFANVKEQFRILKFWVYNLFRYFHTENSSARIGRNLERNLERIWNSDFYNHFRKTFFTAHTMASRMVALKAKAAKSAATSIYWLFYYFESSVLGSDSGYFLHATSWFWFVGLLSFAVAISFILTLKTQTIKS